MSENERSDEIEEGGGEPGHDHQRSPDDKCAAKNCADEPRGDAPVERRTPGFIDLQYDVFIDVWRWKLEPLTGGRGVDNSAR
jgi:hypothetical protein